VYLGQDADFALHAPKVPGRPAVKALTIQDQVPHHARFQLVECVTQLRPRVTLNGLFGIFGEEPLKQLIADGTGLLMALLLR